MTVAEAVATLRRRAGLSQETLAERLDVPRQTVNRWESGVVAPGTEKVLAMADLFGVDADAILSGEIPEEDFLFETDETDGVMFDSAPYDTAEADTVESDITEPDTVETDITESDAAESDAVAPAAPAQAAEQPAAPDGSGPPLQAVPAVQPNADSKDRFSPEDSEKAVAKEKRRRRAKKVIAVIVAMCLVVGIVALPFGYRYLKETWWGANDSEVTYPYVLVHGVGGWGEDSALESAVSYWGVNSGSIADYLRKQGCEVVVPTVGPYSGTWDRACELYAQLTGTRVDYGEAHSKLHNHERYGRTYTEPLVPDWGQKGNGGQMVKVNLVGHSFGGITVRMLAWLMANGSKEEQKATGEETSPLFTGGKGDWVFSVTTVCAPHNGSQLTCMVDDLGNVAGVENATQLIVSALIEAFGAQLTNADYMLDQFGITNSTQDENGLAQALMTLQGSGTDNAVYELSPDGAAQLNQTVKAVEGVYYFSYAFSTMSGITGSKVPLADTLPALKVTALAMGSYMGTTAGGIKIDKNWQDNDGLVSVFSAQYPTGEEHADLPVDETAVEPGIWYVAPTQTGDHGSAVGLNADTAKVQAFYGDITQMIDGLR